MLTRDDVLIEPMTPDDLPEILAIETNSFDDPWPEEVFRTELRHCWSHCVVLRVEATRAILAYLVFWSVVDEVHLLNVAIDPIKHHLHYGRMLVDYLTGFAHEHKARFVTLEVRRSNSVAIELYESCNFKKVGVRPSYYADNGEDAIVMLYDCGSISGVQPLPSAS